MLEEVLKMIAYSGSRVSKSNLHQYILLRFGGIIQCSDFFLRMKLMFFQICKSPAQRLMRNYQPYMLQPSTGSQGCSIRFCNTELMLMQGFNSTSTKDMPMWACFT